MLLQTLKERPLLIVGCCAGSLAVGLVLAVGSMWLLSEPAAFSTSSIPKSAMSAGPKPPYSKTPDGRLIHPLTGRACPKGTKPTGRRECTVDCPKGMFYWEGANQCIPTDEAKVACAGQNGTWIVGGANEEDRCRIPLAEIDPKARRTLDRLGR